MEDGKETKDGMECTECTARVKPQAVDVEVMGAERKSYIEAMIIRLFDIKDGHEG